MRGTIISSLLKLLDKTDDLQNQIDNIPTGEEWTQLTKQSGYGMDPLTVYKNGHLCVFDGATMNLRSSLSANQVLYTGLPKPPATHYVIINVLTTASTGYTLSQKRGRIATDGSLYTEEALTSGTKVFIDSAYYYNAE